MGSLLFVLLANNGDDRLVFEEAFEQIKMQTTLQLVSNETELMAYLANCEPPFPDILFLDLNIPKKSEHACLDKIKKNEALKNLIIVIYSISSEEEDIEEAFTKGAHIYIQKPNDLEVLKKLICDVMSITWQYHITGLNLNNFMLRLK